MRTKNSMKNGIASLGSNIISVLIGFVAQAVFLKILGSEYLGLNGLFTNILSMMSIVEMGIGSAIIYNLYKPIAQEDIKTIKSLMRFYKKSYRCIAGIVFFIGIGILFFLPSIVGEININVNIYIVYLLFLLDTICSYLLSYKRSILYAQQKNYLIQIVHIFYTILLNGIQLLFLFLTKNYYLYLEIKITMRVLENLAITFLANKLYPYLKEKKVEPLSKSLEKDIFKKVKASFFHQIGGFIVFGTDNIIISKFLGLVTVGLYSNYHLIIDAVQKIFMQVIKETTASIGNLLVTETKEKHFLVFKRIRFLNFWISTFTSVCLFIIMDSFVTLWIGAIYLLPFSVLVVLTLNHFQRCSRYTYSVFKEAAGILYEDRFVPMIESFLNIVVSILLVKRFGLTGVFMGTLISSLVLWIFSYPKFVYAKLFQRKYGNYLIETVAYFFLFLLIIGFTYFVANIFVFSTIIMEFLWNLIVALFIPNLILFCLFWKNDHFNYYKNLLKNHHRKERSSLS